MATWDARDWVAGLMQCVRNDLAVRSIDRYGSRETQVRYERGDQAVARVIVTGPIVPMGVREGQGHWAVSAQIGWSPDGAHKIEVPETDEIVY